MDAVVVLVSFPVACFVITVFFCSVKIMSHLAKCDHDVALNK